MNTHSLYSQHIKEEYFSAVLLNIDITKNIKAIKEGKTSFKKQLFKHFPITQHEFEIEYCYYQAKLPFYFQNKKYVI